MRYHEITENGAHEDLIRTIKSSDPESVHGEHIAYHAQLRSELPLPPDTWLIHWTDSTDGIFRHGFTRGQIDPAVMGVTKGVSYANQPGYNFAYLACSKDAKKGAGVYGHEAVLFRAGGVHIYHGGDDEEQVIFWGPDVKPDQMLLLCPDMTTPYWWEEATKWCVYTPDVTFTDGPDETSIPTKPPLIEGSFAKVIKWVTSR